MCLIHGISTHARSSDTVLYSQTRIKESFHFRNENKAERNSMARCTGLYKDTITGNLTSAADDSNSE